MRITLHRYTNHATKMPNNVLLLCAPIRFLEKCSQPESSAPCARSGYNYAMIRHIPHIHGFSTGKNVWRDSTFRIVTVFLLDVFYEPAVSHKTAQSTTDLAKSGEQTARPLQDHDKMLIDNDTDWTEDDIEPPQCLSNYTDGFHLSSSTQQSHSRSTWDSKDSGIDHPIYLNHFGRRLSTGSADLDSPSGRYVLQACI